MSSVQHELRRWLSGKETACSVGGAGDMGSVSESGRRRAWPPTPVFLPGESHGQRSLVATVMGLQTVRRD